MHYAISMADGSVAIMQTVGDATPEQCLAKWHPDSQKQVVSHQPIDPNDIPADRTFRDAWVLVGKSIEHDMDKAKEIKREQLRAARAPALAALDIESIRASEVGDATALGEIRAAKQKLRDVTDNPAIEAAKTVEVLKALDLSDLI